MEGACTLEEMVEMKEEELTWDQKQRQKEQADRDLIKAIVKYGVFSIFLLIVFFGCFATIGAGKRGILLEFGKPIGILEEGWNWKAPLITSVAEMNARTVKYEVQADAASKDMQTVTTLVALNYHLDHTRVMEIYRTIGTNDVVESVLIAPAVQESVKASTAGYNAEELVNERPTVKQKIEDSLKSRLEGRGIFLESVSITDFDFSPEYNKAIEEKQVAQQQALQAENILQRIKIEADQVRTAAQGQADAKLMNAKAEAESIKIQGEALKMSTQVVSLRLIEKWDGKLPTISGQQNPFLLISGIENLTK